MQKTGGQNCCLVFLTGCLIKARTHVSAEITYLLMHGGFDVYGIKVRTHTHVKITIFPTRCIIRSWRAISLQSRAFQVLMMQLAGKSVFLHRHGFCYIISPIVACLWNIQVPSHIQVFQCKDCICAMKYLAGDCTNVPCHVMSWAGDLIGRRGSEIMGIFLAGRDIVSCSIHHGIKARTIYQIVWIDY